MIALKADDERLDEALFPDGIGEFAKGILAEILAGLEGAGADAFQGDLARASGGG